MHGLLYALVLVVVLFLPVLISTRDLGGKRNVSM